MSFWYRWRIESKKNFKLIFFIVQEGSYGAYADVAYYRQIIDFYINLSTATTTPTTTLNTSISENGHFCQMCQSLRPKQLHFELPNQNSKTTFIVQTFPKCGPYDFYLVNLSLLGAILAIFQFCGFSGLFWPLFHCKIGSNFRSKFGHKLMAEFYS